MKPLTDFQAKLLDALKAQPHTYRETHWLAAHVFPGRWSKASGKGAMVGHIDRALAHHPDVHRLPGRNQHEPAQFAYIPPR